MWELGTLWELEKASIIQHQALDIQNRAAAMQPVARVVPRLSFNSIVIPPFSRSLRISHRPSAKPPTCLQCRVRSQIRHLADAPTTIPSSSSRTSQSEFDDVSDSSKSGPTPAAKPEASKLHPEEIHPNLPSAQEGRRLEVSKRFSHLMDHLQGNIFIASQRINDLTGYSGIEALKQRITTLEERVQDAQEAVRAARLTYKATIADRAATQREVTTLLARKDSWTPADLERFTALYRMDHSNEQAVQEAATRLADAEREAEHTAGRLSSSILSRYHEEQIWSDKIRRMSTWGTWGLMGVNVLLFLVFQFGFEPWRRRRLVHGFEEKVREALEKEAVNRGEVVRTGDDVQLDGVLSSGIQELEAEMENGDATPEPAIDAVAAYIQGAGEVYPEPKVEQEAAFDTAEMHVPTALLKLKNREPWAPYVAAVGDLFSPRIVQMKKQDVTIIAIESAAVGATLVTIVTALLLRLS